MSLLLSMAWDLDAGWSGLVLAALLAVALVCDHVAGLRGGGGGDTTTSRREGVSP